MGAAMPRGPERETSPEVQDLVDILLVLAPNAREAA